MFESTGSRVPVTRWKRIGRPVLEACQAPYGSVLDSARSSRRSSMASLVSNVSTLVESGLRGPALTRRRALGFRLVAVLIFLGVWSLAAGIVVVFELFNPIFLPGPWLVLGSLAELAAKGQLWIHIRATLER